MVSANIIVGIGIIILNLIPIILNKPRYLILTGGISLFLALLLVFKII